MAAGAAARRGTFLRGEVEGTEVATVLTALFDRFPDTSPCPSASVPRPPDHHRGGTRSATIASNEQITRLTPAGIRVAEHLAAGASDVTSRARPS